VAVQAAQVIICPAAHCVQHLCIDPQWEVLTHGLLINGPGVDHRLRGAFSAQHNQEIAHHLSFPLIVQLHRAVFLQLLSSIGFPSLSFTLRCVVSKFRVRSETPRLV
jgi:hypothetical protein